MAVVLREMFRSYNYYFIEDTDQRTKDWPLMSSPVLVSILGAVYLWFSLKAGPAFMKNRRPFQIDRIVQIYNLLQVALCTYTCIVAVKEAYGPWGRYSIICQPLDLSYSEDGILAARMAYLYFLLKILDLVDTVFFVLRKKNNQISFLHVYHHFFMLLGTWLVTRWTPGGHLTYVGTINCFVHAVMYFYYFISNYNSKYRKKIWWKKYITLLQLFQFGTIFLHALLLIAQPNCNYPKLFVSFVIPQNLFIFFMFLDFYKKNYLKPEEKTVKAS